MSFICEQCSEKILCAINEGYQEAKCRADCGENLVELCVEYENERQMLINSRAAECVRYWFLYGAADFCHCLLSAEKFWSAGWKMNSAGAWTKTELEDECSGVSPTVCS